MDVYIYGERRPLPEGFAAYHDRWRSAVVSRCCASGLARRSIGRRGGSKPARGAPAELILTRPEPKSGERAGMAAISLNPFQTSSKKVNSGCVPDAKTDSR